MVVVLKGLVAMVCRQCWVVKAGKETAEGRRMQVVPASVLQVNNILGLLQVSVPGSRGLAASGA